jgi:hypothetical protein
MSNLLRQMLVAALVAGAAATVVHGQQGRGGAAPSPRAAAPVDLTGVWTPLITEDWRWRMRVPPKGDYASVPLNPAGVKLVESWDPARDAAAGEQCRGYAAPAVMRLPGRVRISWDSDTVMKVETEAGSQTRLFVFGAQTQQPQQPAGFQGTSAAFWQPAGGGGGRRGGGAPGRGGSLRVVTTNLKAGYLRRNGVPFSANARLTEYYNRTNETNGDSYLVVTTLVEDPTYLNTRWVTSTHFKKLPDNAPWTPGPCE